MNIREQLCSRIRPARRQFVVNGLFANIRSLVREHIREQRSEHQPLQVQDEEREPDAENIRDIF